MATGGPGQKPDRKKMTGSVRQRYGLWRVNKLHPDRLDTVILASIWDKDFILMGTIAKAAAQKLTRTVTAASDTSMPQQRPQ